MKPGTIVKMSRKCKDDMIKDGYAGHVEEFGACTGVVIGLTDYGSSSGPEVDVRWKPSNLRYAYHPDELINYGEDKYFIFPVIMLLLFIILGYFIFQIR